MKVDLGQFGIQSRGANGNFDDANNRWNGPQNPAIENLLSGFDAVLRSVLGQMSSAAQRFTEQTDFDLGRPLTAEDLRIANREPRPERGASARGGAATTRRQVREHVEANLELGQGLSKRHHRAQCLARRCELNSRLLQRNNQAFALLAATNPCMAKSWRQVATPRQVHTDSQSRLLEKGGGRWIVAALTKSLSRETMETMPDHLDLIAKRASMPDYPPPQSPILAKGAGQGRQTRVARTRDAVKIAKHRLAAMDQRERVRIGDKRIAESSGKLTSREQAEKLYLRYCRSQQAPDVNPPDELQDMQGSTVQKKAAPRDFSGYGENLQKQMLRNIFDRP